MEALISRPTPLGDDLQPAAPDAVNVLVVDDELVAREVACMWLNDLGYAAYGVASAAEALAVLRERRFDILFSDVYLRLGLDGFELAVAATRVQPWLRVCFASANAWGPSQRTHPRTTFLHKPYSRDELATTLKVVQEPV